MSVANAKGELLNGVKDEHSESQEQPSLLKKRSHMWGQHNKPAVKLQARKWSRKRNIDNRNLRDEIKSMSKSPQANKKTTKEKPQFHPTNPKYVINGQRGSEEPEDDDDVRVVQLPTKIIVKGAANGIRQEDLLKAIREALGSLAGVNVKVSEQINQVSIIVGLGNSFGATPAVGSASLQLKLYDFLEDALIVITHSNLESFAIF
jgi:hypothetical protein